MERTKMKYKSDFGTRLRIKLNLIYSTYQENTTPVPQKEGASSWYANYLLTTHSIIRASVPLMQTAYQRCRNGLQQERELLNKLREYYKKHIQEEMNHDKWLLDDLDSIGITHHESLARKPLQIVAELVGSQYYLIFHWHPVCLLGYISYLEGNPPQKETVDQLQQITGFPESAFRTMTKHSDLDPHHRDELTELLESLPLTTEHEQWITSNALYTANKLIDIRREAVRMN